jgi:hypothetical protein
MVAAQRAGPRPQVYNTGRALDKWEQLIAEKRGILAPPDVLISSVGTKVQLRWQCSGKTPASDAPLKRCTAWLTSVAALVEIGEESALPHQPNRLRKASRRLLLIMSVV